MEHPNPYESPAADGLRGNCVSDSVVEFDYTMLDAIDFSVRENQSMIATAIRRRQLLLFLTCLLITLAGVGMWRLTTFPGMISPTVLPLAIVALILFIRALQVGPRVKKAVRKSISEMLARRSGAGVFGRHQVTLTDEGIRSVFPGGESSWKWWAIAEVIEEDDKAYFYLTATEARIIPARAFANDAAYREFVDHGRRLWVAGRNRSTGEQPA